MLQATVLNMQMQVHRLIQGTYQHVTLLVLPPDTEQIQANDFVVECFPVSNTPYAFTAAGNYEETKSYSAGTTIEFTEVVSNIGGAYQHTTSEFVCPVQGVYAFVVSLIGAENSPSRATITVDDTMTTTTYAVGPTGHHGHSTNIVIIECAPGERVRVQARTDLVTYCSDYFYTTFSGWLIQATG